MGSAIRRDDLDVDDVAELVSHLDEGFHAAQPDDAAQISVRPDRGEAVRDAGQHGASGPVSDVLFGERRPRGLPCRDGAEQVASGVDHPISSQRLVEMGVRLGRSGQEHEAREVLHLVGREPLEVADRDDALALDPDVDGRAVGRCRPKEEDAHSARR